jgi:peptidoglycan-associated lipoprotein
MNRSAIVVALVLAAGCAHQPEAKPESAASNLNQNSSSVSNGNTQVARQQPGPCSADLDCAAKQLCIRGQCVDITANLEECKAIRVHFEFNAADLAEGDKASLDRSARCLKADHDLHVTIEGNADERGTEEYNLALGDKRATAVSSYLQSLGASDSQLKTVSYGKENPLCSEHDEACWAKNRRAAVKPAEVATTSAKKKHR